MYFLAFSVKYNLFCHASLRFVSRSMGQNSPTSQRSNARDQVGHLETYKLFHLQLGFGSFLNVDMSFNGYVHIFSPNF